MMRLSLEAVNGVRGPHRVAYNRGGMHDVSHNVALCAAPAPPFDRWAQSGGIADRLVRTLSVVALLILLLWPMRVLK